MKTTINPERKTLAAKLQNFIRELYEQRDLPLRWETLNILASFVDLIGEVKSKRRLLMLEHNLEKALESTRAEIAKMS